MGLADCTVTAQLLIRADASTIYDFLADPANHSVIDGSDTVAGQPDGPSRLAVGDRFTMGMQRGVARYRTVNIVAEAEPGRAIAWRTVGQWRGRTVFGGHVWGYELRPYERSAEPATVVRHTFDWSAVRPTRLMMELPQIPQRVARTLPLSLERLERAVTE